ncbi:HEPN domain-containing protein [Pedobacter psychrodurus]|uniref:HEPN domain-containing protein n=1 Tax=Pedobacter psychrodurus TaxID=2530456 RepID=UPI00293101B4|nr:HEPN domain-containing protein [Pedobacter psychrodurus]
MTTENPTASALNEFGKYSEALTNIIYNLLIANPDLLKQYESQPFQYQELDDFSYGLKGPEYTGASFRSTEKRTWIRTSLLVSKAISQSPDYLECEKYLQDRFGHIYTHSWFGQYLHQLIEIICATPNASNSLAIDALNTKLIRSLSGSELPTSITIELDGLILESREIILEEGIILRQTQKSDFEKPIEPLKGDFFGSPRPTAILELKGVCKRGETGDLSKKAQTILYQLTLFFTCSVQSVLEEMEQESITKAKSAGFSGTRRIRNFAPQTILATDEKQLICFLQTLEIPPHLLSSGNEHQDYLSTAFDRYRDALTEDVVFERRVATAVMGIEALLSSEKQELSFRIQTRTARLLSLFDQSSALEIRSFLATAYGVRSHYAHGGFLTKREKDKIIRAFGDLSVYARNIIGLLRKLIVIFIAIKADKTQLLSLIDDSLIDEDSLTKLKLYTVDATIFYR